MRELVSTGRQSLKTFEKQLPALTKALQEPKKALDQALTHEKELSAELAFWQKAK